MTKVSLRVPEIEIGNFWRQNCPPFWSRDIRRADLVMSKLGISCSETPKMTNKLQINMFLVHYLKNTYFEIVTAILSRHIGFPRPLVLPVLVLLCSPFIFRKSRQGVSFYLKGLLRYDEICLLCYSYNKKHS